jgi:pimeloyl-ACP methyl ester carboxylesterase
MQLFSLRAAFLLPLILVSSYALFILSLTIPSVQRNAFYANKLNPSAWQDLSNVEQFGFHCAQVVPFAFHPRDDPNISLHAWYLLPVKLFVEHEAELKAYHNISNYPLTSRDLLEDSPLQFLISNESTHLIISFHGNAAHLASSHRPSTYQQILGLSTPEKPVHVIAFDYRGFGLSTGSPSEAGLIADAVALLQLISDAGISMDRVTLLGQSLGTAVSVGAFHHWTRILKRDPPRALILLASFSSVPSLMDSYSLKGIIPPFLSGLDYFPKWVKTWIVGFIADTWDTGKRLGDLWTSDVHFNLYIMHAKDDWEIPWREGWKNFLAVADTKVGSFEALGTTSLRYDYTKKDKEFDLIEGVVEGSKKRLRWELIKCGGHNRVAVSEQMKAVVLRSLDSVEAVPRHFT